FRAADNFSSIKRAEYSVDAGDWQFVEPVGQLSDAKTEAYDFRIAPPVDPDPPGAKPPIPPAQGVEHVVVVRVYDRYDNMVSAKTVIRGKEIVDRNRRGGRRPNEFASVILCVLCG